MTAQLHNQHIKQACLVRRIHKIPQKRYRNRRNNRRHIDNNSCKLTQMNHFVHYNRNYNRRNKSDYYRISDIQQCVYKRFYKLRVAQNNTVIIKPHNGCRCIALHIKEGPHASQHLRTNYTEINAEQSGQNQNPRPDIVLYCSHNCIYFIFHFYLSHVLCLDCRRFSDSGSRFQALKYII